MLRIDCPCCGPRDHDEFRYGGDASVPRPHHEEQNPAVWHRYVFIRSNPRGPHREFWQHAMGCRQWLIVGRDTATHTITEVRLAGETLQERSA
jgi:methylglutamate dehydrogenase subunit B